MQEVSTTTVSYPSASSRDALTEVLRSGAQRLLAEAIEAEVAEWIDSHARETDAVGRRQVVRNGYLPKRSILTGIGPVEVEQPRILDRRGEEGEVFSSKILPPYLRKTRSLEELIPWLYLTGDGALGFWKALDQVYPTTRAQRCWVHKTANVLDKLPKRLQPGAKESIHQIWMAETRQDASDAFDLFLATYEAKYPKACECLSKDRPELLTFYDFPAEHWKHLRTTNPIESTFATVRLRHRRTKGSGSRTACLTMVFKLMQSAAKRWRLLNGSQHLADVIQGIQFIDGIKPQQDAA